MKAPRGLVCVVALLAVASSFAASPKKQAFGPVAEALDICRKLGIKKVDFAMTPPKK